MSKADENRYYERLIYRVAPGSRLLRVWKLTGGVSAQITAIELEQPGGPTQKLIVRQHGDLDRKQNPQVAAGEFRLLRILHTAGLAVPQPVYLDESCEILSTPYLVTEFVEGSTEFAPADLDECIKQMATHLSRIHALDASRHDLSFLPQQSDRIGRKLATRPVQIDESLDEERIRDVLETAWPWPQRNHSTLLHGDFWPGNLLWQAGRLEAVVDWEDAEVGDPLADVANTRMEILWAFDASAMSHFTVDYLAMTPVDSTTLPYWDLLAALRPASRLGEWAGDRARERAMRTAHRFFVSQAFAKLSGR